MDQRRDSASNLTGFRTLITFSSHVRTMNRAVLGAGHGLTVTLEIRHSVIPGGFVRACARREHPPSFGEPLSCDHYFRLSRSASPSVLTSHPSSFNSSMRRLSLLDVFLVLSRPCLSVLVRTRVYAGNDLSYSLFHPSMQVSLSIAPSAKQQPTRLPLLAPPAFFPRPRDKKIGEPSLVNFGRNSAHFALPRDPRNS